MRILPLVLFLLTSVVLTIVTVIIVRSISRPIRDAVDFGERIASGDELTSVAQGLALRGLDD